MGTDFTFRAANGNILIISFRTLERYYLSFFVPVVIGGGSITINY